MFRARLCFVVLSGAIIFALYACGSSGGGSGGSAGSGGSGGSKGSVGSGGHAGSKGGAGSGGSAGSKGSAGSGGSGSDAGGGVCAPCSPDFTLCQGGTGHCLYGKCLPSCETKQDCTDPNLKGDCAAGGDPMTGQTYYACECK
jgi:hypothetical protein